MIKLHINSKKYFKHYLFSKSNYVYPWLINNVNKLTKYISILINNQNYNIFSIY